MQTSGTVTKAYAKISQKKILASDCIILQQVVEDLIIQGWVEGIIWLLGLVWISFYCPFLPSYIKFFHDTIVLYTKLSSIDGKNCIDSKGRKITDLTVAGGRCGARGRDECANQKQLPRENRPWPRPLRIVLMGNDEPLSREIDVSV